MTGWMIATAWFLATLGAYVVARWLQTKAGGHPLANPVLLAASPLIFVLWVSGTPFEVYQSGGRFWLFWLGPATVALAVPLYANLPKVKAALGPMILALAAGSSVAVASALGLGWMLGASRETILSLAPKSVTTPIAMAVSDEIGGLAALAAAFVIVTGVIGAILAGPLFDLLNVKDARARGFAMGVAAHGIGTARAFQIDETTGTFSGAGMTLNGILTGLLLPALILALS